MPVLIGGPLDGEWHVLTPQARESGYWVVSEFVRLPPEIVEPWGPVPLSAAIFPEVKHHGYRRRKYRGPNYDVMGDEVEMWVYERETETGALRKLLEGYRGAKNH